MNEYGEFLKLHDKITVVLMVNKTVFYILKFPIPTDKQ